MGTIFASRLGKYWLSFVTVVTCALALAGFVPVSEMCGDEVVVSSAAAPSVRAGKKLFEKQLSAVRASCQLTDSTGRLAAVSLCESIVCDKCLQFKALPPNSAQDIDSK